MKLSIAVSAPCVLPLEKRKQWPTAFICVSRKYRNTVRVCFFELCGIGRTVPLYGRDNAFRRVSLWISSTNSTSPSCKLLRIAAISPGMVKVEHNDVLVLVDSAEHPDEIDAARAQREADESREALLQKKSRQEHQIAQATLARALNRLRVKNMGIGR